MSCLLTVVSTEVHSSDRIGRQGKKGRRPSSNSGPTLYRGVLATRTIDPGRDPSSPCLKAGTVRAVVVAGSAAASMLHDGIHEPEMEAASISLCVSLSIHVLVAKAQ